MSLPGKSIKCKTKEKILLEHKKCSRVNSSMNKAKVKNWRKRWKEKKKNN
jgi:hypothetical protein